MSLRAAVSSSQLADFGRDLAWADQQTRAPYWEQLYRQWFPDFLSRLIVPDGVGQRKGRDTVLVLTNGDSLRVQEKARRREDTGDVLIEYAHVYPSGFTKPGWIATDASYDYIAYVFVPSRVGYLFPFQSLRAAWLSQRPLWEEYAGRMRHGFRVCRAENRSYTTHSLAVPTLLLYRAVYRAQRVTWG